MRSPGARLLAALTRCRSALAQARTAARQGDRDAPFASGTDAAGHARRAKLFLVSERLEEAHRAMDEVAGLASALAEALERERAAVRTKDLILREADRRIRSSLQGLAGLLRLQAGRSPTP